MKKVLPFLILLFTMNSFSQTNSDSLWNVIHSQDYSDSLKLEAYEVITKDLINVDKDSCRIICNEAINFARSANNTLFEWSFFNRIGITYLYESNYEKTFEYWRKAIRVAEASKDTFALSQNINNLAYVYEAIGDYKKAITYFNQAIDFKQASLKKYRQNLRTVDNDDERSKINEEINNTTFAIGMQRASLALAYAKINEFDSAANYLIQTIKLLDQLHSKNHRFELLTNVGTTYAYLGSHQKINRYLYDALKYLLLAEGEMENVEVVDHVTWLFNIGEVYFYLNDKTNGYKYIHEAQVLAKEHDLLTKQQFCYKMLWDQSLSEGDYEKAYFYRDSMLWIKDSINKLRQEQKIAEIEAKYETEKKERENLELKQEVREQEIENIRDKRMRNVFIISTAVFLIFIIIIVSLFRRLRIKNFELIKSKKELELLNQNLRASKEETEKALEFKSLFLANMSHEIRTPLNIIIGFNSILKKQLKDAKPSKYLESIEMASYNLLRLLNDILDMSKIEAGKILLSPETINLRLLIMNIRELFALKANEKGIDLDVEIDPKMPAEIVIDEIRLRQILVNIIGNAIKFTENGFVKINVDAPVLNKYQSEYSTKVNVRIRVTDSGIGISKEDVTNIFESFRQVNIKEQKQMGGTGLGLAISKRLSEMMNGEITVESQKGKGSTFTILFRDVPIGVSQAGKSGPTSEIHEELEYEFTGGSILVADDEEMNRSLIKVCFENTAVTILEASNGNETIELSRKYQPDIVMMDIKMPGLDGMEATRIIKQDKHLQDIKVIAFSASNIFDRLEKDEVALYHGLISKPVLLDDMFEMVSKILPSKIKEKKIIKKKTVDLNIDLFIDDNIKSTLQNSGAEIEQLKQKWQTVYSTNSMNRIIDFANEIEDFAVTHNLPKLSAYAQKVAMAGKNFDITLVKELLKLFPEILNLG